MVILLHAAIGSVTAGAEALRVLQRDGCVEWLEVEPSKMLNAWLSDQVDRALDRRLARVESLFQKADVAGYQREMREVFIQALGGFPDRTPLDARVTGVLDRNGYRIEKILYYSQPGFPIRQLAGNNLPSALWPVSDRPTPLAEGLQYRGRPSVGGFGGVGDPRRTR